MARALVGGRGFYIEDLETKEAIVDLERRSLSRRRFRILALMCVIAIVCLFFFVIL